MELDRRPPLDAVLAVDDQGTVAAAHAGELLGLRHNPPDAVEASRDKLRTRALLASAEVPQPAFAVVRHDAGATEVEHLVAEVGLPCVVKPTTLSGSQGVIRADTPARSWPLARVALDRGRRRESSRAGRCWSSDSLPAPRSPSKACSPAAGSTVLAVFDKPDPLDGPFFEETLYVTPSRLDAASLRAGAAATQAATRALGLTEGPVHAELRVRDGRAWVIEVAARSIGGLCSRTLEFGTGRSLEYLILAQALGEPVGLLREQVAAGVLMLPIRHGGTLVGVEGRERALEIPGVVAVEVMIAPGRPLVPLPEGNRYLGFVFARGERPDDVETALRQAQSVLEVRVEPDEGLRRPAAGR